ncbi:ABC transporter ATP-binding protein [Salarchaeum japonicum]|uniref:Molybdate/tungstate import ATP-binding protein WtpC n=1 Tax=Salarchaeum japonicum TaxID=555573 RepID=A0AAV3T4G6_9EURY|nr:ABC transporter ATP-binding protein [Salarchaeum japonicum]
MTRGLDARVRATFTTEGAEPFDVDAALSVPPGETLVVLGPSGSGKSLLLESLAGLHDGDGHVRLDGRDVTDDPPDSRGFGFVFQDYALFSHRSVRENVAFGQRYQSRPVADADDERSAFSLATTADETAPLPNPDALLAALGVADLAERSPDTLSGGERQRVALARALAVRPDALLLDEPLSALDEPTRRALRDDLAGVLDGVTAVYVTHDRTTARALADRVAVMADGRIRQTGTPAEVFETPETPRVARFVGANVLNGTPFGYAGERVAVRPEHVELGVADASARGTVERVTREDAAFRVVLDLDGERVAAFTTDPPTPGETVALGVADADVTVLAAE